MQIIIDLAEYKSITGDLKNYIIENRMDFTKACMMHLSTEKAVSYTHLIKSQG